LRILPIEAFMLPAAQSPHDVLIIGGGISGTIAATVLGRAGYDVCLIDRYSVYPRDFRAEHLDGEMVVLLNRLGVLDELTQGLFQGDTVTVGRNGRRLGTTKTVNYGLRYEALVNRARELLPGNVQTIVGRATQIETSATLQRVHLADGRVCSGRLIIMATGLGSGLCRQVGISRTVLREGHSLTFGFEIEPVGGKPFSDTFIVYQREDVRHRMDYFAAFTMSGRTRVNLFTYRDYKEPWTKAFIADPEPRLREVMPGLEGVLGPYRAIGPVEARPIDLYVSENAVKDGIVLIGDAFQASCPATGTGLVRLLTDIEQLCRIHLPQWMETPGMNAAKIASFYRDPVKRARDAKSLHDAVYRRAVSTETSLQWRMHRARVQAVEQILAWCHRLDQASLPRISAPIPAIASPLPG
jgi:2-polyprenyl-6-methoxyphenol hydroxylase-like FAD-dependent oxidoreductase